jgi:hypothetical protein
MDGFGEMGGLFSIVPVFIIATAVIMFIIIFVVIIINISKGAKKWSYNNSQPVLTVNAKVVAKRTDVSSGAAHHDADNMNHYHTYTSYYVTFEVESGDRMEFGVMDGEYGMLVEEDRGKLTFQGTRYMGFKRGTNEESHI